MGPTGAAWAQGPNKIVSPAVKAQQDLRFPQKVRVGALLTWPVIAAGGRYKKLGDIVGVFQPNDDDPVLVIRYGSSLFKPGRLVAPSLQDVALVGPMVKLADIGPADLAKMATFTAKNGAYLKATDTVKIGVDKKY
jgi:hypothetical protein